MYTRFTIAFIILVILSACKTTKKNAAADAPPPLIIKDESFRKPINDKDIYAATIDAVPIDTAYIHKDTLHINTKKVNGCETDNFKLLWTGKVEPLKPRQVKLKLLQTVDASCTEKHKFQLTYNISNLYMKKDTLNDTVTLIHVSGWKDAMYFKHAYKVK